MLATGQTITAPHRRGQTAVTVTKIIEWPENRDTFGLWIAVGPKGREWRGVVHRDGRIQTWTA